MKNHSCPFLFHFWKIKGDYQESFFCDTITRPVGVESKLLMITPTALQPFIRDDH